MEAESFFGFWNTLGYRCLRLFGGALLVRPYFRLAVRGRERLPSPPYIIAPNHISLLDPVVVQTVMPVRIVYMMTSAWYDRPLLRPFFRFMRSISVQGDTSNRKALEEAVAALDAGVCVGVFPEGSLSPDGTLQPFVPGVASLAFRARVPVVPVAISGTRRALPRGRVFPSPHKVTIRIGDALSPMGPDTSHGLSRREMLNDFTVRLHDAVTALQRGSSANHPTSTHSA